MHIIRPLCGVVKDKIAFYLGRFVVFRRKVLLFSVFNLPENFLSTTGSFFTLKYPCREPFCPFRFSRTEVFSGSRTILWTAGTFRFSSRLVSYEKRTFYWLEISWTMYLSFQTSYKKPAGCIKAVCGFVHWLSIRSSLYSSSWRLFFTAMAAIAPPLIISRVSAAAMALLSPVLGAVPFCPSEFWPSC